MAFDAFFLKAVLSEITPVALGARVEKIHQPSRDTVIFHLRCETGRQKLLFAPNPAAPRLHFTASSPENPDQPPMFCMLLRKHLSGARLSGISQMEMERMAEFIFDCTDEMGYPVQKKLIVELMGKTCNLYLVDGQGRILDCLRRVALDESAKRAALPGFHYQKPEEITKQNPEKLTKEDYVNLLRRPGADVLADRLMDNLGGLSPLVCREAVLFATGETDTRVDSLEVEAVADKLQLFFAEHLAHPKPWYYPLPDGTPKQFAFCPIYQYGKTEQVESFSGLMDSYYIVKDRKDAMRQKSQSVRKTVSNLVQRLTRKIAVQEKELAETHNRERLRQLGDIVTANLHKITKGQRVLQAEDFYDEQMPVIDIPLSVTLSPQQNAAKFYKDYTRMKNAEKELTRQLALGQEERSYLQSVLEELNRAETEAELEEIRQELQSGGYLRSDGKKRLKQAKSKPMEFVSTDGYRILVGRNNRQNEELTFKTARRDDLWLHASKVHGSHVIILCGGTTPPDDTVTQAAQLAAFYSESTGGQNIAVDATQVKQVKKTPGAKPGMVIYHTYRTVVVNPYRDIVVDPLNAEKKDG
ncbi:MAG: NFACT family protein [Oscillospiraceae bacterium]|nr:NFACT family protein [Oscillospiraceae bacterium]